MIAIATFVLQIAMFVVTILVLPSLGPGGLPGFIRYSLYAVLLWGCFILSTSVTSAALGGEVSIAGYLAAAVAAYFLGTVVFLGRRPAATPPSGTAVGRKPASGGDDSQ